MRGCEEEVETLLSNPGAISHRQQSHLLGVTLVEEVRLSLNTSLTVLKLSQSLCASEAQKPVTPGAAL